MSTSLDPNIVNHTNVQLHPLLVLAPWQLKLGVWWSPFDFTWSTIPQSMFYFQSRFKPSICHRSLLAGSFCSFQYYWSFYSLATSLTLVWFPIILFLRGLNLIFSVWLLSAFPMLSQFHVMYPGIRTGTIAFLFIYYSSEPSCSAWWHKPSLICWWNSTLYFIQTWKLQWSYVCTLHVFHSISNWMTLKLLVLNPT